MPSQNQPQHPASTLARCTGTGWNVSRRGRKPAHGRRLAIRLVGASFAMALSAPSQAQSAAEWRGMVGGSLLGAEAVLLGEAAFGVRPKWAYAVGGGVGAVGGAVGGYFLGGSSGDEVPAYLIAGGLAVVMPTILAVVTATQYRPPETFRQDVGRSSLRLEWPALFVRGAFSDLERTQYGVAQRSELHLTLLRGTF